MRLLVVYTSKTGFTKRYAQWLAEDLSGDCFPLEQAARVDFSGYDAVAFGSSVHAGGVRKLAWLKKRLPLWRASGWRCSSPAPCPPRRKPWSSAWPRTSPPRSGSR